MTWNLAQKDSFQKRLCYRNAFFKKSLFFQDKVEVAVSYCFSLTFIYMNSNLPSIVTTPCMLYNCHCITALSSDAAKKLPW